MGRGDPEARAYLRSPGLRADVRRAGGRALPDLPRLPRYVANVPARELPRYRETQTAPPPPFPFTENVVRTPVYRPLPQSHPAAHGDFASYANATERLALAPPPAASLVEAPARGFAPPSAPPNAPNADDNQAWNEALARGRTAILEENRAAGRRIPRPGNPAVGIYLRDRR